jgi:endonuclease YncB( thermonuclease family)
MRRLAPLLLAPLALLASPAGAATVLSVGDGDTLRVRDGGRLLTVRLACIDAPEIAQKPYGARAREALQQLAPVGSEVALQIQTRDRYGRSVAEVFRGGENLNLAMVRQGAAFAFRKYLGQCQALTYLQAESQAEFRRAGVWATPGGITRPWEWRADSRGNTPAPAPRPVKGPASVNLGVMTGGGGSSGGSGGGGGRYYCKNLSHQEAQRLLSQGHTYLDRDGDGEACEGKR